MYDRPHMHYPHPQSTAASGTDAGGRLAIGLLASALVHVLWLGLAHPPALQPLTSRTAEGTRLALTLARPAPALPRPSIGAPIAAPPRTAAARRRTQAPGTAARAQPTPAADPAYPAASRETAPASQPTSTSAPETTGTTGTTGTTAQAPQLSGADLLAAARQDAAAIARELNHAPGSKTEFRSQAQEELDRRFDAAHAAGGAWFRAARVEEITTAADGNRRVYRIVTPLGAFCRTYYGDGKRPMNTTCPR